MATIQLHTPMHMQDNNTITAFEANDIIHIVSVVGDDDARGTHFYLRGVPERQFCSETAKEVKRLVASNKATAQTRVGDSVIHIQGNVANIQSGNGNVATVWQSINPDIGGIIDAIQVCRNSIGTLNQNERQQVADALEDLEAEVKSESPKKSKLISFLKSATEYATTGTALFTALEGLAKALNLRG